MQPPESSTDGSPSPTRRQLQGPRPPQLRVRKDSHMIKKPPIAPPQPSQAPPRPPQHTAAGGPSQNRQPVIIYAVSPKVIHTTVTDFMSLVQRLTGSSSTDHASSSSSSSAAVNRGDVSPAARLASIERTSPRERERDREREVGRDMNITGMVEGIEMGFGGQGHHNPGILSPAPATLPPISPAYFFSPRSDPLGYSILQDLSSPLNPFNFNQGSMFMTSPSTLFSAPMASPSPSSFDLFNNQHFFDF